MSGGARHRLPSRWIWVTLGDIRSDRAHNILPSKSPEDMFELYSVPSFASAVPELVKGGQIGSNKRTVESGTVLLCKINPRINRSWVVGNHSDYKKIASTEWIPFFPTQGVDPHYLCYYLRLDSFRNHLAANASGVGGSLMRARLWSIESYPFPLAPLPEQRRIVAEIEKHFTRLDAAVASLQRARANLKRYRASVLRAACEGRLVPTEAELARREGCDFEPASVLLERILEERRARWEAQERRRGKHKEPQSPDTSSLPSVPEGWVWATVGQLCDVGTGSTPLTTKREYYEGGTIPWVTSEAVNSLQVTAAQKWVTEQAVRDNRLRCYPAGTLILAMYGEGHNRGKVSELLFDSTINQALAALVFEGLSGRCRGYVKWFLLSRYEETRRAAVGGVQPNLNLSSVAGIPVPLPPLTEQHRIVSETERHLSVIQVAENVVEANLKRAERLRQAVLRRAFEGKLVPQDPTDEPASVLLGRIRAEREQAGKNISEARRRTSRRRKAQGVTA